MIDTLAEPVEEFHMLGKRFGVKTSFVRGDTAAGICIDEPLVEADWEHSQRTSNVNVMGTFWTIKLLAKHLVDTKTHGSIVTIASLNGQGVYVPVQPCAAYNASKAAVKGLMGPLGAELGEHGIRINSISPGKQNSGNSEDTRLTVLQARSKHLY